MKARSAAFAGTAVVAVLVAAVFGDVHQWIPIDAPNGSAYEPIFQSPAAAFDVASAALGRYAGLPHDAQLRSVAAETSSIVSGGSGSWIAAPAAPSTPIVTAYTFTWQPRDDVVWGDHVIVSVGTALDQRCAGNGTLPTRLGPPLVRSTCRSYDVRYGLHATWVRRVWQPWPVRALTAALQRWNAPLAPEPSSLITDCKHVDIVALRRVAGTMEDPVSRSEFLVIARHGTSSRAGYTARARFLRAGGRRIRW